MNPVKEITNRRPSNYSHWHRNVLPQYCRLTDGDWFEMRKFNNILIPVACIETMEIGGLFIKNAQDLYPLWETKASLLQAIKDKMNIPVFIVRHTSDCKLFSVARLSDSNGESLAKVMSEEEYTYFLENLQ